MCLIACQAHRSDGCSCVFTVVVVLHDCCYFQEDDVPDVVPRRQFLGLAEQAARSGVFSGERKMIQKYVGIIQRCDVKKAY